MQCNIDRKGRTVRMVSGTICVVVGVFLSGFAWLSGIAFWTLLGIGLGLFGVGLFQIYESRKGWCAMRAMGIKTPL